MEPADLPPDGLPVVFLALTLAVAAVAAWLLLRVARSRDGVVVGLIAALLVVAGALFSFTVLALAGVVISLALDGSAVYSSLVSVLLTFLLHLVVWTLIAWGLVRLGRSSRSGAA